MSCQQIREVMSLPPDPPHINNNNYICLKYCPKGLDHLNFANSTSGFERNMGNPFGGGSGDDKGGVSSSRLATSDVGMSFNDKVNTFLGVALSPLYVMQNVTNIPGGDEVFSRSMGRATRYVNNASLVYNAGYYYFSDGKFSIGDGARVLSNLAYNTPYAGKVYMAVDIGFGIDGYSLTDRFGDWIDYHLGDYHDVDSRFFIQKR